MWHQSVSVFSFPPLNLASSAAIMGAFGNWDYFPISVISGTFHDYYCGIIGYCSKHYIFKQYFLRVDCPFKGWTVPLKEVRSTHVSVTCTSLYKPESQIEVLLKGI